MVRPFFFLFFFKEGRLSMRMTTPAVFLVLFTFEKTVADCVDVVVLVFSNSIIFSVSTMNASVFFETNYFFVFYL